MSGVTFHALPAFSGTIYGNNHHLYNLTISETTATAALFQSVSGTIVQLVLSNITSTSTQGYATGFAGALNGGMISSCGISGAITSHLGGNGYNSGTGNSVYVTNSSGSVVNTTQSVNFNGNTVNATI